WPGRALTELPQALPPLPVALEAAPVWVSLNRIIYAPDATLVASGPQLFLVDRGRLVVRLSGAASWFAAGRPDAGWRATASSGQTLTLEVGDALFAPAGVDQTQRNPAAEPAAATSLAIFPSSLPAGATRDVRSPVVAALAAVQSASNRAQLGVWTAWPSGVWVDVLADWYAGTATAACLVPSISLNLTRFALAPGASLPAQTVAGVTLLARDDPWLVGDPPAARAGVSAALNGATEMTEQGLGSVDGRSGTVRNIGRAPLRLILATLTSASPGDAACLPANPLPAAGASLETVWRQD
ncbi:MAG TPA: hypothetical protein VFU81_17765, partial [Thermomicrobiales bacterium]|nr:hypothetical protein [Thermomicrobiales bacterium]